ncbi:MAG TPA: hypothetical protein VK133_00365 [Amoebophilaceae bacterium]|nr:hypothetical protein [Amoebophilaceae bacterium]
MVQRGKAKEMLRQSNSKRHSASCPCREHIRTQTQFYGTLLKKLGSGGPIKRQNVITQCDPCFIRFLGKYATGLLHTNIRLKKEDYSALKDSKDLLLKLAHPNTSVKVKRSTLKKQTGAAIPFFSILGSLASTVLGNLFLK